MGAAHFGCVDVAISILLQRAIIPTEYKAGEDDALVTTGARFEIVNILPRIRRIAHNQKLMRSADALECFDYQMRIVFRLQPRNIKDIAIRFDAPSAHHWIGLSFDFSS